MTGGPLKGGVVNVGCFAALDVPPRSTRVRAFLQAEGLDALAVTAPMNVRWLTGFTGSHAVVLIAAQRLTLFTDGRYSHQAPRELAAAGVDAEVVVGPDALGLLVRAVSAVGRLGLEAADISWSDQRRLAAASSAELVATDRALLGLRAVKDAGELDRIRAAAAVTDAVLAEVVPSLAQRPTERDVALALDHGIRERGATSSAYETIVASGSNGALPHARPTDRVIEEGDLVVIDVGSLVDGYRSDMTRSFVVGEANSTQRRQLEVVRAAQAAGVAVVRAGVEARDVDHACREVIAAAGWADQFSHGTGHGVGLDIHEQPRINARSSDILESAMLVTVEPGVYLQGQGGVRWEDLLHVTPTSAEVLTKAPKVTEIL
ncbi:MAG: M24 family metallopeptidase [Acidimicrobiales bacterium]